MWFIEYSLIKMIDYQLTRFFIVYYGRLKSHGVENRRFPYFKTRVEAEKKIDREWNRNRDRNMKFSILVRGKFLGLVTFILVVFSTIPRSTMKKKKKYGKSFLLLLNYRVFFTIQLAFRLLSTRWVYGDFETQGTPNISYKMLCMSHGEQHKTEMQFWNSSIYCITLYLFLNLFLKL